MKLLPISSSEIQYRTEMTGMELGQLIWNWSAGMVWNQQHGANCLYLKAQFTC